MSSVTRFPTVGSRRWVTQLVCCLWTSTTLVICFQALAITCLFAGGGMAFCWLMILDSAIFYALTAWYSVLLVSHARKKWAHPIPTMWLVKGNP